MTLGVRAVAHIRPGAQEPVLNVEGRARGERRRRPKDADSRPCRRLVVVLRCCRAGRAARCRVPCGNDAECCERREREHDDEQTPTPAELVRWLSHVTSSSIYASPPRSFPILSAGRSIRQTLLACHPTTF